MMNGFTGVDPDELFSFTSQRHNLSTRSAANKFLVAEKCHLNIRKYFFSNRIVHKWNSLPLDVREANSVNDFKNLYDDWTAVNNE